MTTGKDLAILEISMPQVLGERAQEMITTGNYLVFSSGCNIFVYSQ
jgi:hypothetical protein